MGKRGPLRKRLVRPPTSNVRRTRPGNGMVMRAPGRKGPGRRIRRKLRGAPVTKRKGQGGRLKGYDVEVEFKIFWANCTFSGANVFDVNAQGSGTTGGQLYLDFVNTYYFPTMVTNQVKQYTRYRCVRQQMLYTCKLGATINTSMNCAYFDDPEYFESIGKATGATAVATTDLVNVPNCTAGPAWRDMVCPLFRSTRWCYTDGPGVAGVVHSFATNSATDRQTIPGVYGFVMQTNPTPGTASTVGEIYLHFTLQLKGMKNVPTTSPTLSSDERKMNRLVQEVMKRMQAVRLQGDPPTLEEKKQEDEKLQEKIQKWKEDREKWYRENPKPETLSEPSIVELGESDEEKDT